MKSPSYPRHDGHEHKVQGYYEANDNIVKYGCWVVILLVISLCLLTRLFQRLIRLYG